MQTDSETAKAQPGSLQPAGSAATPSKITVAGVTFGADEVVSAVVKLDGREIHITKKEEEPRKCGFAQ